MDTKHELIKSRLSLTSIASVPYAMYPYFLIKFGCISHIKACHRSFTNKDIEAVAVTVFAIGGVKTQEVALKFPDTRNNVLLILLRVFSMLGNVYSDYF